VSKQYESHWSRREFLQTAALAGAGALFGAPSESRAAEPPPETTRIRLYKFPGICLAPQYVAEDLLRAEGFTDVQYVEFPEGGVGVYQRLGSGAVDITQWFVAPFVVELDRGLPILFLAGIHVGCLELFGSDRIRTIRDLKGKTIAVPWRGPGPETFIATMLANVGLDPRKDINFVVHSAVDSIRLLAAGEIDGYLGNPPVTQELRAKKIGRVVVNSSLDRPWSQYFCCLAAGNREFVHKHPVATKRALRAILKADQICALEPERVARAIVDRGFTKSYEYALQTIKEVPYGKWRDYDPEDTVRFYSLRLHEAGMIKSSPQKMIAQGTDWRFLRELKKELKNINSEG
jgi:NitT/TauT family transport system substrate-binding protein